MINAMHFLPDQNHSTVKSLNRAAHLTVHLGYHGSTRSTAPNVAYL